MNFNFTYLQYISDVTTGRVRVCRRVKQAVARHVADVSASEAGTFPYVFDHEAAKRAIVFSSFMVHTKGELAGQRLSPEPWQQFLLASIFGWKSRDTGLRRFRRAYVQIARKNGKTFLSASVGLYDLMSEPGAEVYSAATKKDQAARCFLDAKRTVEKSRILRRRIAVNKNSLVYKDAVFQPLSKDTKSHDGLNPSCSIIDEYHAHKTNDVMEILNSGKNARTQPLMFIITTAGFDKNCPCFEEYERCCKILSGARGFEDEQTFALIYELDEKDDWKNRDNWVKANPNLGVSVRLDALETDFLVAMQKTSAEAPFRVKSLNAWLNTGEIWISDEKFAKCRKRFSEKRLEGLRAWGGIDVSKRTDFTAFTLYFDLGKGKRYAKHWFFIPEAQIDSKMKTDSYLIRTWIKQGYITAIPGETVDLDYCYDRILPDWKNYDVQEIAVDRNLAERLISRLSDTYNIIDFAQNIVAISEPSKDWEKAILENKIIDNNPVMAWMVSCCTVRPDANGNIKPLKPDTNKSSKRIDGVITSIMANNRLEVCLADEAEQRAFDVSAVSF